MTIFEMSGQVLESAVEKLSLTSLVLATSVFTLTVGYLSKVMFKHQHTGHTVSINSLPVLL